MFLVLALGSCAVDGTSFIWRLITVTFAPQTLDFPMLPGIVFYGDYYQHDEGNYSGAYTDHDGHYYSFTYLIEADLPRFHRHMVKHHGMEEGRYGNGRETEKLHKGVQA